MKLPRHNLRYLYKYRSVADAERILVQRTIRCSHPAAFNDLLDGQVNLRLPIPDEEFKGRMIREYMRLIYLDPPTTLREGSTGRALVACWRELADTLPREEVEAAVRDAVAALDTDTSTLERMAGDQVRSNTRGAQLLCLSETPTSMPMWYHYADQFRGVVVAFDGQQDPQTLFSVAQKVEYAKSIPQVCDADEWIQVCTGQRSQPADVVSPQYLIKSDQWAPEKEWRVIAGLGPPGSSKDLPLTPEELGGIVIGLKTDKGDAERLISLARAWQPSCSIWKTRLDYSCYGFTLEKTG